MKKKTVCGKMCKKSLNVMPAFMKKKLDQKAKILKKPIKVESSPLG